MNRFLKSAALIGALTLTATLAACSSFNGGGGNDSGAGSQLSVEGGGQALHVAITDGDTWEMEDKYTMNVYMFGSSSCKPTVEEAWINDDIVTLRLKDHGNTACTMDYVGPIKYTIQGFEEGMTVKTVSYSQNGKTFEIPQLKS